jgi:hypothetical protein
MKMGEAARRAAREQPEVVDIVLGDDLFAKQTLFPCAGTIQPQEAHEWDHVSFISHGSARVWCDGEMIGDFEAPHGLMIRAGVKHTFGTLADNTIVSCIHRIDRTGEIDLVEEHNSGELV